MTHFKSTGAKKGAKKMIGATASKISKRHKPGHPSHKTAGMKHRKAKK
jgi:hypothetical protein